MNGSSVTVPDTGRICHVKIAFFCRDIDESGNPRCKPARPQGRMQFFLFDLDVLANQPRKSCARGSELRCGFLEGARKQVCKLGNG